MRGFEIDLEALIQLAPLNGLQYQKRRSCLSRSELRHSELVSTICEHTVKVLSPYRESDGKWVNSVMSWSCAAGQTRLRCTARMGAVGRSGTAVVCADTASVADGEVRWGKSGGTFSTSSLALRWQRAHVHAVYAGWFKHSFEGHHSIPPRASLEMWGGVVLWEKRLYRQRQTR